MSFETYFSRYVESNGNINNYGGHRAQEFYFRESERAVRDGIIKVNLHYNKKGPKKDVFWLVHDLFVQRRRAIAFASNSEGKELYGVLRDKSNKVGKKGIVPVTCLYKGYAKLLKTHLVHYMKDMKRDFRDFQDRKCFHRGEIRGVRWDLSIEIYSEKELRSKKLADIPTRQEMIDHCDDRDEEGLKVFREGRIPKFSDNLRWISSLYQAKDDFPSPTRLLDGTFEGNTTYLKSLFLMATERMEVDGIMRVVGQHHTWMYQTYQSDIVERMVKYSECYAVHSDEIQVSDLMKGVASLFHRAISWTHIYDSENNLSNFDDLQFLVIQIRRIYGFCMFALRGGGAIGDWIEMTIYRFHGFFNVRHSDETLPAYEAISGLSLENYIHRYDVSTVFE